MRVRQRVALLLLSGCSLAPFSRPAAAQTVCEGRTSAGTLVGGLRLDDRPYLRIKRGSEQRVWGHPILLALVRRAARAASLAVPGSVALIGDLSAPRGGFLSGHASHQSGRDADVAFFVADGHGRPVTLAAFEAFGADGRSLSDPDHVFDAYRNWLVLRAWLTELRVVVTHVFIAPELRQLLLDYGRQSPEFARYAPLAAQVLHPYPNHADHFHLRIACPTDQDSGCLDDSAQP